MKNRIIGMLRTVVGGGKFVLPLLILAFILGSIFTACSEDDPAIDELLKSYDTRTAADSTVVGDSVAAPSDEPSIQVDPTWTHTYDYDYDGKPIDDTPSVTLPFDMDGEQEVSGADEAA